jgi:MoaA/NifB/PqqE/SkfB family radical SAM enzyme
MDEYLIDSHKLIYHPKRVADYLAGENVFPIYVEASPSGACNHRCKMCALDFLKYGPNLYDLEKWETVLDWLKYDGIKSIMYAGEGEPFTHAKMNKIVKNTHSRGIDVAITTNGVLFTEKNHEILERTEWIKVSVNAGTKETYANIHGCDEGDFEKVLKNIESACKVKGKCTIGVQSVLLPENIEEMRELARRVKDIGADYLVLKPYSQHPSSITHEYENINYHLYDLELNEYNDDSFKVIFREDTIRKWNEKERPYKQCRALSFWCYIDSSGGLWGCSACMPDNKFYYGNVFNDSFEKLWNSEDRLKKMKNIDVSKCRINCRMDEVNRYLWKFIEPPKHRNFI